MERPTLNLEKIRKELPTVNEQLDAEFGKIGTSTREAFSKDALAFYYGLLIKETRKEQKLTQKQLAEKIGKEREYITKIEQGKTDLQISNLTQIIQALGKSLQIV